MSGNVGEFTDTAHRPHPLRVGAMIISAIVGICLMVADCSRSVFYFVPQEILTVNLTVKQARLDGGHKSSQSVNCEEAQNIARDGD